MSSNFYKLLLISIGIFIIVLYSLFLIQNSARADITTGLVGYWKFDEGSGTTAADSSGNNNTGTLKNGPTWTTGKISQALSFDGVDDYVNAGSAASLDNIETTGSGLTVSAWIYAKSYGASNNGTIVSKGGLNSSGYWQLMFAGAANRLLFEKDYDGANDLVAYIGFPTSYFNAWKYVVATWDGSFSASNVHIFLNGAEVALTSATNGAGNKLSDASNFLGVGAADNYGNGSVYFDGLINEVRIYNRALSASEVQELYNYIGGGTPTPTPTPTPSSTPSPSATPSPSPPPDTTPPVRSLGSPSGILASGTTQTIIYVTTNEDATCKYSTVANTAYASMSNTFSTTGTANHSTSITGLSNGNTYNYYIRCQDTSNNANPNDYIITFSVATSSGTGNIYWIDDNGTQTSLSNCQGTSPLSGSSACAPTVNWNTVIHGDTVYFRGGTYNIIGKAGFKPSNSGISTSDMITFSAYNNETVNFVGDGNSWGNYYSIDLTSGQSYIKVHGIIFTKWSAHLYMKGASYNEISHCQFLGTAATLGVQDIYYAGSIVQYGSHHNWIHDCTFSDWGSPCYPCPGTPAERGTNLQIGWDQGDDGDDYNILENCLIYHAGHDAFGVHGKYNIVRGNKAHNEPWMSYQGGTWGQRIIYTIGTAAAEHIVFENNKFGYSGYPQTVTNCSDEGITVEGNYNIYRYNTLYQNAGSAISLQAKPSPGTSNGNVFFNNTFWYNGYDPWSPTNCINWHAGYDHAISVADLANNVNNSFINNLFYQNKNTVNPSLDISNFNALATVNQIIRNNWIGSVNGDPKFVNISGTPDPMQTDQFNFGLQSSSGAINGGAYLTQANGSGSNSTSLVVNNASFFQDGFRLQSVWPTANINADWIAIGTVTNVVQISSINYSTNTITLSSPMTWSNGANVWLYRKSDGIQVLYGSTPDYGAYEYISAVPPPDTTPPSAPTGVAVN